ncbi:hypothetical protein [Franconibacter helveticus]|uniref:hypothetical protein n=1 Tax=Franconibacter helveticus TaxID=357240 RepID=UPI002931752A|nr:hypothetical protein [Franconibacter helveticus]
MNRSRSRALPEGSGTVKLTFDIRHQAPAILFSSARFVGLGSAVLLMKSLNKIILV